MRNFRIATSCLILYLCSCTSFEEINIKQKVDPKYAAFSILYPGDSVFVTVKSLSRIGEIIDSTTSNNALIKTVKIYNLTTQTATVLSRSVNNPQLFNLAQVNFPIIAGNAYRLEVEIQNALTLTAETIVPEVLFDTITLSNTNPYYDVAFQNYLFVLNGNWQVPNSSFENKVLVKNYEPKGKVTSSLLSGANVVRSGNFYSFKYDGYFNYEYIDPLNSGFTDAKLGVSILSLDQNFKVFSEAYDIFQNIDDFILKGFGLAPLGGFKGVVPKYSNIKNGYGIFGSCTISPEKKIVVKYPR